MDPLNSFCLCGVVLLSLVLPLAAARTIQDPRTARPIRLTEVWVGQACGALAGLLIVFSPIHPVLLLMFAALCCSLCWAAMQKQIQTV